MRFIRFGVESFRLVVVAYFPKIILRNRFRTIRVAFHWSIDLYHFIRVALKLTVYVLTKIMCLFSGQRQTSENTER